MSVTPSAVRTAAVFRIDQFVVPAGAMDAFTQQLHSTQQTLNSLPGCRQNLVLTQSVSHDQFNVMTLVEWENDQVFAAAKMVMQKKYAEAGFDAVTFMRGLGVRYDFGLYRHFTSDRDNALTGAKN